MKIKIKPWEEINETLNLDRKTSSGAYFDCKMEDLCGTVIDAEPCSNNTFGHTAESGSWSWHTDWYDVVGNENDFVTKLEEPEMIKQTRDKMLLLHNTRQQWLEVMQSFIDGKKIEYASYIMDDWCANETPSWDWVNFRYRVLELN